ncbi:MAG TPA: CDP-alcohol phosphatidyltransferase family protein [Acidimicrobiia bacterium]|nr:CDP-alcohol phosphatidyltransferase family protein [Acidimicrobiia bacterium]
MAMEPPAKPAHRFGVTAVATPANVLTVARIVLAVPTLILVVDRGASWLTVGLWFVLTSTDGLDGWLARRDGATRSGAFLDPLADKILILGGFFALVARGDVWWVPVALIATREVFVSIYRSLAARRGISLPARQWGKWKAFVQMLAVGIVLFPPTADAHALHVVVVWTAVALAVISALDIVRGGWVEARTA